MARRRRATSTSTTDGADMTYYTESSVLQPVDPAIVDSQDWPCFMLSDATVHNRDGTLANMLDTVYNGPFIVRGRLDIEPDNAQFLVNRQMRSESLWIQIEVSRSYSLGLKGDEDNLPLVWASGLSGWFEIAPSRDYLSIAGTMFDGVCLFYTIDDAYQDALEEANEIKKKKRQRAATMDEINIDLDEILFQYTLNSGAGLTLSEAKKRLDEQATFLLSHLSKGYGVYKYLAQRFPDVVNIIAKKSAQDPKLIVDSTESPLKAHDYSQRAKSKSLEGDHTKGRPRGRPRKIRPEETPDVEMVDRAQGPPADFGDDTERKARFSTARSSIKDEDALMAEPGPSSTRVEQSVSAADREDASLAAARIVVGALEQVRQEVKQKISKPLSELTAKSWQTKCYGELSIRRYDTTQDIFLYHAGNLVRLLGPEWHKTKIYEWARENASKPPVFDKISEAEILQVGRRKKLKDKIGVKSSPQHPAGSVINQTPRNHRPPNGFVSSLRPSTGSKKRLRHLIDDDDEMDLDEDGVLKKKTRTSHNPLGEEDDEEDDEEDSSEEEDEEESSALPLTPLVIRAEKLPSTVPQGPNHTWTCEEPDCGYVVRAAHEEEGQRLINAHFEEHDDVAQETAEHRANLALQEGTRGHMPINHLLEKIRNLSQKSTTGRRDDVELGDQPEPIQRTLLI